MRRYTSMNALGVAQPQGGVRLRIDGVTGMRLWSKRSRFAGWPGRRKPPPRCCSSLSDAASFITGQVINVSGGLTMAG